MKKKDNIINKRALETQKLEQEVKSLKLQRTIAVIGVIITLIPQILGNLPQIKNIFVPPPKIRIIINDAFVERIGKIKVVNLSSKSNKPVISTSVKEAVDWMSIEPGSYEIILSINDKDIYSQQVLLKAGDIEPIIIPNRDTGNIEIQVVNHTPNPAPEAELDLSIDASGNGYLWIFDYKIDGTYQLIYPNLTLKESHNEIFADQTFEFPDKNDQVIKAGQQGEERLLFIITSSNNLSFAQQKALQMSKIIIKASVGKREENWGASEITYIIEK